MTWDRFKGYEDIDLPLTTGDDVGWGWGGKRHGGHKTWGAKDLGGKRHGGGRRLGGKRPGGKRPGGKGQGGKRPGGKGQGGKRPGGKSPRTPQYAASFLRFRDPLSQLQSGPISRTSRAFRPLHPGPHAPCLNLQVTESIPHTWATTHAVFCPNPHPNGHLPRLVAAPLTRDTTYPSSLYVW